MKTKIFFLLTVILIFSLEAFSMDPRTEKYLTGVGGAATSGTGFYWASKNKVECAASEGWATWACVWAVTAYTGATASGITALANFYDAATLSTDGKAQPPNIGNILDGGGGIPDGGNGGGVPGGGSGVPSDGDIKKITSSLQNIIDVSNQELENLKAAGHMPPDLNDPSLTDKLPPMTPEQKAALQDYENKKSKLDAMSTQEKVDMLLSGGYEDYSSTGSRTVAESNEFEIDSFDPNSLLALFQNQGMENSAPGYYGNVPLQVLNPHSKLSLFQRVSLKMKNFK